MAKNPLPLIVGGVAALLLMGGKKKPSKKSKPIEFDFDNMEPYINPSDMPNTDGASDGGAGTSTWIARQQSLATVAGWGKCSCDPGDIDGSYGPKTKAAVKAFQGCASIGTDGKWGPKTEAAMKNALATGPSWPGSGGGSGDSSSGGSTNDGAVTLQEIGQYLLELGYQGYSEAAIREFQHDWSYMVSWILKNDPKADPSKLKVLSISGLWNANTASAARRAVKMIPPGGVQVDMGSYVYVTSFRDMVYKLRGRVMTTPWQPWWMN